MLWVENHIFLAIYGSTESPDAEHYPYIINRKAPTEEKKYQLLEEITPIYNSENFDNLFYMSVIRNFGPEAKTMIIVANAIASDLAVIGQHENGSWKTWNFEEGYIPSLPLSEDDYVDTLPVGIAVDFSASKALPPFDASETDSLVPPMPIFMFLTNEGRICAYHIYNTNFAKAGERYSGMVTAQDVHSIPAPSDKPTDLSQTPSITAPTPASTSQTPAGPFATALSSSNNTSGSGISNNAKIPSFSDMRVSASSVVKPNPNAFGAAQSSAPIFGSGGFGLGGAGMAQKSSFASLAKTSTQTSSVRTGSSGFGTSTYGSQPTFGSTSTFGNLQKTTFGSTSPLGSAQPTPLFGAPSIVGEKKESTFTSPSTGAFNSAYNAPTKQDTPSLESSVFDASKYASTTEEKEEQQQQKPFSTAEAITEEPKKATDVEKIEEKEAESFVIVPNQLTENRPKMSEKDIVEEQYPIEPQHGDKDKITEQPPEEQISIKEERPIDKQEIQATISEQEELPSEVKSIEKHIETNNAPPTEAPEMKPVPSLSQQEQNAVEEEQVSRDIDEGENPVKDVPTRFELPSRPKIATRFASLPKKTDKKPNVPQSLTATHVSKAFFKNVQ